MEYAAIMVSDELIRPEHLRSASDEAYIRTIDTGGCDFQVCLPEVELSLEAITNRALQVALERCAGNKSRAAALLKVDRKRFYR
jgi:DNA-binding NtrC family response regulator